jgi:AcrR family transcriptional regulator
MGPDHGNSISDRRSVNVVRRGRPASPPDAVLAAADALFAGAESPATVSMDAIAAAAGVGKGTLFRAFGNRRGLLDALWAAKLATLRQVVEHGEVPLGPGGAPDERAVAFLDALLIFKFENQQLIRARELGAAGLLQSEHYRWMHGLLREVIEQAVPASTSADAGYAAHALLAAMNIDLVEDLLASGHTRDEIRRAQATFTRAVLRDKATPSSA